MPTVAVIVQYFLGRRTARRIGEKGQKTAEAIGADAALKVQEVHTIVNQQRSDMLAELKVVKDELVAANGRIGDLTDKLFASQPVPQKEGTR